MKKADLTSKVSITKDFFESLFNFQGPARDIRGYSSAGRAPALQAGGQRFDPAYLHHDHSVIIRAFGFIPAVDLLEYGLIAQLVRAHA